MPLTKRVADPYVGAAILIVGGPIPAPSGPMVQKVIDVVGASPVSFAKAAEDAVAAAGKTVRGLKWARVAELEMELDGPKVKSYRATLRVYFDVERGA